jgi:hypothetical protein
MINKELLNKGFELNSYTEGKFYELTTTESATIEKILNEDYRGDEETVVLQLKEDLSNKIICVDSNVCILGNEEFVEIINRL